MLVKNHIVVLWVMKQHTLLGGYQCFRGTRCLRLQDASVYSSTGIAGFQK
jgi:hypothetical protein